MTTSNNMNIVGVAGKDRSGKDTVAEIYIEKGYFGFSFGDAVRKHALKRHKGEPDPISVKNMTETSNWLRTTYGADVILREALGQFEEEKKKGHDYEGVVLYSVRAPIEADFIIEHCGKLIWVDATDEVRHQRRLANIREGEAKVTMEDMLAQEVLQAKPQQGIPAEVQMDLSYVQQRATITIENNGDNVDAFKGEATKVLGL